MMFRFISLTNINYLWLVPLLVLVYVYDHYKRKAALLNFIHDNYLQKISSLVNIKRRRTEQILLILSIMFIVLAMARPGWNPQAVTVERKGRDVVFIIDISRSMLAEDIKPNRLERAKTEIIDTVSRLSGSRVALLEFAGTAVVKSPLTTDYAFFRTATESLSVNDVSRGGTMLGDALREAMTQILDPKEKNFKDIILITDGEDHESFPVEAAKAAGEQGVRLIIIGLGDENQGTRIPIIDTEGKKTFLTYNGEEVWTKLDAGTLREMAAVSPGGKYLNVGTGAFDLGEIYLRLIASAEKKDLQGDTIMKYQELFQYFIFLSFIILLFGYFKQEGNS
ncbi:MAG: VWA domain-containing protein [Spirochaetia bacterium]|jgi:Ca-activated chloride channel family protein|nr:VWA domain-containing protein [Spirochaetia bacterium]